jgi:hypothetical protein
MANYVPSIKEQSEHLYENFIALFGIKLVPVRTDADLILFAPPHSLDPPMASIHIERSPKGGILTFRSESFSRENILNANF